MFECVWSVSPSVVVTRLLAVEIENGAGGSKTEINWDYSALACDWRGPFGLLARPCTGNELMKVINVSECV